MNTAKHAYSTVQVNMERLNTLGKIVICNKPEWNVFRLFQGCAHFINFIELKLKEKIKNIVQETFSQMLNVKKKSIKNCNSLI